MAPDPKSWTRQSGDSEHLISTDKSLLDRDFIGSSFALKEVYWCKPVSPRSLDLLIENSCCFGMYVRTPSGFSQIGMARLVTDYATVAYLTDVLIIKEHQGQGLGRWLMQCIDETVEGLEDLRRFMLLTGKGARTIPFYEGFGLSAKSLDDDGLVAMVKTGPGASATTGTHG